MARIDFSDPAALNPASSFLNPASYANVKAESKKADKSPVRKSRFLSILNTSREEAAAELNARLGIPQDLPVSEETVNQLLDDVRSAGDELRNRPFPEEIIRYKRAVHNFLHYVKENAYAVEQQAGVPNYLKPRYKGPRGTPKSQDRTGFYIIQVVDKKLEEMAARILSDQLNQLELLARLEEITGLLVDLLQ